VMPLWELYSPKNFAGFSTPSGLKNLDLAL